MTDNEEIPEGHARSTQNGDGSLMGKVDDIEERIQRLSGGSFNFSSASRARRGYTKLDNEPPACEEPASGEGPADPEVLICDEVPVCEQAPTGVRAEGTSDAPTSERDAEETSTCRLLPTSEKNEDQPTAELFPGEDRRLSRSPVSDTTEYHTAAESVGSVISSSGMPSDWSDQSSSTEGEFQKTCEKAYLDPDDATLCEMEATIEAKASDAAADEEVARYLEKDEQEKCREETSSGAEQDIGESTAIERRPKTPSPDISAAASTPNTTRRARSAEAVDSWPLPEFPVTVASPDSVTASAKKGRRARSVEAVTAEPSSSPDIPPSIADPDSATGSARKGKRKRSREAIIVDNWPVTDSTATSPCASRGEPESASSDTPLTTDSPSAKKGKRMRSRKAVIVDPSPDPTTASLSSASGGDLITSEAPLADQDQSDHDHPLDQASAADSQGTFK